MNRADARVSHRSRLDLPRSGGSDYASLLDPGALQFMEALAARFAPAVAEVLSQRVTEQRRIDAGALPDFPADSAEIRESTWRAAAIPADLQDRRVEITGPADRKMVINALNSGARTFMADLEDASTPAWRVMMDGQVNLRDAVQRQIEFTSPDGRHYAVGAEPATLIMRPRGLHLVEAHVHLDGKPIPAPLWDFGLYFYLNAGPLVDRGSGPYFYLPKLQARREAKLWNDIFNHAQDLLGLPRGTIRATVLIETIQAAFQMDEILYELRDHAAGLNCGRWDYIFSFIKCFRNHPEFLLADRASLTMDTHFLRSYSRLAIQTCHRRGVHAMGGMAAQIPIKDDPDAHEAAMRKVRRDKEREARDGHDGSWVSHPAMVPVCREVFDRYMPGPNQIDLKRETVRVTREDLLGLPPPRISIRGLMGNVSAALRYTESWLGGQGAVPLHNLMEDAATAEIARAQVWQWIRFPGGVLEDGRKVTAGLFRDILANELETIRLQIGDVPFRQRRFRRAAELLDRMTTSEQMPEFLTVEAYDSLD